MSATVLFFDSGVGGLSVFREVRDRLVDLNYHYIFDNLCFPYGIQPDNVVIERVCKIMTTYVSLNNVDIVVIACNTASTVALEKLRNELSVPVVGVVPAIKPAANITKNGIIGLLATPATIRRQYTQNLIDEFAKDKIILKIGSSELVEIAERKLQGLPYDENIIGCIVNEWNIGGKKPDTVVLGCTHFPLIKYELSKVLPQVTFVDSGEAIARRVETLLNDLNTKNQKNTIKEMKAYCTDARKINSTLIATMKNFGFYSLQAIKF